MIAPYLIILQFIDLNYFVDNRLLTNKKSIKYLLFHYECIIITLVLRFYNHIYCNFELASRARSIYSVSETFSERGKQYAKHSRSCVKKITFLSHGLKNFTHLYKKITW